MRGLSERVQRGMVTQQNWEQTPGVVHKVHRATQPPDGLPNGKFGLGQPNVGGKFILTMIPVFSALLIGYFLIR